MADGRSAWVGAGVAPGCPVLRAQGLPCHAGRVGWRPRNAGEVEKHLRGGPVLPGAWRIREIEFPNLAFRNRFV